MPRLLKYICPIILIFSSIASALEVDEKLTLRVLRTSSSKKTMLINRGQEDGLAEGDHAKFYLSSGIVARGTLVKISPTRSIWAVYRLVDNEAIALDKVMNMKISTPVKLTKDRSKMLSPENEAEGAQIALAAGAEDLPKELNDDDKQELSAIGGLAPAISISDTPGLSKERTLEIWGLIHFNGASSSTDRGADGSTTGSTATLDFSIGFEKYFSDPQTWYHRFSIFGLYHVSNKEGQSLEGTQLSLTTNEFGAGVNWHFLSNAQAYSRPIGFLTYSMGVGSSEEVITVSTASGTQDPQPFSGSSTFYSLGVGFKYYLSNGFGLRTLLDYYNRTEKYTVDGADSDFSKTTSGPRIQVGLAFRW
jgi:hypothetical protein